MKKTVKKTLKKAQSGGMSQSYKGTTKTEKGNMTPMESYLKKTKAPASDTLVKPASYDKNTGLGWGGGYAPADWKNNKKLTKAVAKKKSNIRSYSKDDDLRQTTGSSYYKKGGSTFGMLSVKAGVDKNPKPTAADRIAGAKMSKKKMGGALKTKKK